MRPDTNKLRSSCLFCDPSRHGQADQILLRSDNFYIFAGIGAIIEGYLIIAPYTCKVSGGLRASIADIPLDLLDELAFLRGIILAFYLETYGHPGLSFEHGRAGGCTRSKEDTRHCYHPHLCCYPGVSKEGTGFLDHGGKPTCLWDLFALPNRRACNGIHTIKSAVGTLPYLYVEHYDVGNGTTTVGMPSESRVFIVPNEDALDSQFLRRKLAELINNKAMWDWKAFPTEDRALRVIGAFSNWLREHDADYGIEHVEGEPPRVNFETSVSVLTARAYERITSSFKERWQDMLQYNTVGRFLSQIPCGVSGGSSETIRLIDVGCGPGIYSKVFADLGFDCTAVDYSKRMLQEAGQSLSVGSNFGKLALVHAGVEDLSSVVNGPFDAIWFSAVLLHIPRREAKRVLRVLSSLLTDEGVLYLSTRLLSNKDGCDFPALEVRQEGRVFVYYQLDELEKLFADASLLIRQSWKGTTTTGSCGEKRNKPWRHYLLGRSGKKEN